MDGLPWPLPSYQVNATMIDLYWGIGEFVSHKAMQDGWGRSTVKNRMQSDYSI